MKNKNRLADVALTTARNRSASISNRGASQYLGAVLLTLSVFAWVAPFSTALGQEIEAVPPPAVEPEPEVSVPELINRADVSVAIIQTANGFLDTGELDLAEITEALAGVESEISEVLATIIGELLDELSLRELELVDQGVVRLQSQLISGTELVEQEAAELDGRGYAAGDGGSCPGNSYRNRGRPRPHIGAFE